MGADGDQRMPRQLTQLLDGQRLALDLLAAIDAVRRDGGTHRRQQRVVAVDRGLDRDEGALLGGGVGAVERQAGRRQRHAIAARGPIAASPSHQASMLCSIMPVAT